MFLRFETSFFGCLSSTGELETAILKPTELRVSKEWWNGTWAAIPSYPDLVMTLGLSVPQEGSKERKEKEDGRGRIGECSPCLEQGKALDEVRYPVKRLRNANVDAIDHCHTGHDWNRTIKCGLSVKEEFGGCVGALSEQEEQNSSSPSAAPRSPRSGGQTPVRFVFRQLQQDSFEDGTSSDLKENRVTVSGVTSKPYGVGLKWKAGRKRHRQGDLVTSRVDRKVAHPMNEGKDCSIDISKEEVSSDGDNVESAPLEDAENFPRRKNGEGAEIVKHKRHRKGNDSSLKALHGTPMGSSLFIGSLPIANLVMSR